jgi:hypothetical protein
MAVTWPIAALAEFRGLKAAGEFKNRETGELVPVPARAQFELESEFDGSITVVPVSVRDLDKCVPPFDVGTLTKGDVVELRGRVVLQDRGSARDSFAVVESITLAA